jgi:hypothetical protein
MDHDERIARIQRVELKTKSRLQLLQFRAGTLGMITTFSYLINLVRDKRITHVRFIPIQLHQEIERTTKRLELIDEAIKEEKKARRMIERANI